MEWTVFGMRWAILHGQRASKHVQVPDHIVLTGSTAVVMTHSTAPYLAVVIDTLGQPINGVVCTFASATPATATIGLTTGIAASVAPGSTDITASYAGLTSNTITLVVAAQVATSPILLTPSTFSIGVGGTQALASQVYDQATPANLMVGAAPTYASGTPANATVNATTGIVTGVAPGPSVITATLGSATGTATATVASGSPVTSIVATTPAFTIDSGTTKQLAILDQTASDVTAGCTFLSNATGTATVGSGGLVTPVLVGGGTSITVTHTASGQTATVYLTVLQGGRTLIKGDDPNNYANNAAFWANCSLNGCGAPATGGNGVLYNDIISGGSCSNIYMDTTTLYNNRKTFQLRFPQGGANGGAIRANPGAAAGITDVWTKTIFRYTPGFTTAGSGGGAQAYKCGQFIGWANGLSGRCGMAYSNGASLYAEAYTQTGPTFTGGVNETLIESAGAPEWNNGRWYVCIWHYYASGGNTMNIAIWRKLIGVPLTQTGTTQSGAMVGANPPGQLNNFSPFGENMNQVNLADKYINFGPWEVINGTLYPNPYGV